MRIREALSADGELLLDLLLEAFNWTGELRVTRAAMLADEHTQRYLGGWLRPGDFGLVALDDGDAPVGALWARALASSDPGYGYVADDIPEIGMAVAAGSRRAGVGTALLTGGIEQARGLGWRALSLSVEDGNATARALYDQHGFTVVGRNGNSDRMLREL